jgi:glycosyltransferase involved in cell wall biosynthesis
MKPDVVPTHRPVRLAYLVSHPIQYQAPLLRRLAQEPDIDLTVLFGSDFSLRAHKDPGFGVDVAWDVPLLAGYTSEFLPALRDNGTVSATSPISRGIYSRLKRGNFDALWVHGYASVNALQAILSAKRLGIPVLLRAEGWMGDRPRAGWKLAAKSIFFRALQPFIAAVLPIGHLNAAYWSHYLPATPQFPVPYAVDNAWFAARAQAATPHLATLRTELHLPPERPVILFASKLQPRKHADHLLEAFAALLCETSPTSASSAFSFASKPCLVIVGDGEERQRLERQAAVLNLSDDVRFAGFRNQTELPAFFRLASVFVLPSRHEPWGLIVNEAMACGCPVIVSTDVGSHADLVTDGMQGFVYPAGDIPALTAALHRVFATPTAAATMGAAAKQRMETWSFNEDIQGLRSALDCIVRLAPKARPYTSPGPRPGLGHKRDPKG